MHKLYLICWSLVLVVTGCSPEPSQRTDQEAEPQTALEILESPASGPSGEPNLFVADDGSVYLSWISHLNDSTDALLFSTWAGENWTAPRKITSGSDWFVNWADFPSLAVYPGGKTMAVHWLAKRAAGTYDYDVHISQSTDGGMTWGTSFIPHTDGIAAEHGFVTLLPLTSDRMMAVWLDGRNTKTEGGDQDGHGHKGAMTLRSAAFDPSGALYDEAELDHRICDCCQTDAALTDDGPIVVYRDRSEREIRDIYYTRRVAGAWTEPRAVYADNWEIAGCPVNGPAIAADSLSVAVAWFSSPAEGGPQVKVSFSEDGGGTFGAPVRIDGGNPAGRVDIVLLNPRLALVSWLENREKGAEIRAVQVSARGMEGEVVTLTETSESRSSGFPILVRSGEEVFLAWTEVGSDRGTRVKVGKVNI